MIRNAVIEDLECITAIYNQAIDAGFQTAFTEHLEVADRRDWFAGHSQAQYPIFVHEEQGNVTGWLSVSPYRPGRAALRFAAEISYFIDQKYQGLGIGKSLLGHSVQECRRLGFKTLLAIVLEPNTASIKLLKNSGFEKWAHLPGIADFDGVECSQVYYGLKLE